MFISVFDLFKVGIGPSSSHTMGPMVAANRFLSVLKSHNLQDNSRVRVTLYGSLAFTGKGHATDRAVMLGLLGQRPDKIDPDMMDKMINELILEKVIAPVGLPEIRFDPEHDLVFNFDAPLERHPNGMVFTALRADGSEITKCTYFSIGGGFVLSDEEFDSHQEERKKGLDVPYRYANAKELLALGEKTGLSIGQIKFENEKAYRSEEEILKGIDHIWQAMNSCIERGIVKDGVLPGSLKISRRAADIKRQLDDEHGKNDQALHICNEWLSVYAMAVNEENAAGGRVVTAPTNGAAGVIPAVLRYYLDFVPNASEENIPTFMLTAAVIGAIIKNNASISGAEVGCQGEVGSASSMAAGALCAVLGGTNAQIENASEIALEHHLGMTCDPAAGLVQVPCIERNGLGAVQAVTAAALAMRGTGDHFMPLDNCIETMRQTGMDMRERYKETSRGGLAVNLPEC